MKKFSTLGMMVALAISLGVSAGCTTVPPGEVGIKVNLLGDSRGVSKEATVSGAVLYIPGMTRIIKYPVFNQRVVWTEAKTEGSPENEEINFNTRDQIRVDMDASLNYTLSSSKVPEFYTQYRFDKISMFSHGILRDICRNAVTRIGGEYAFEDLNGAKKEEFLNRVEADINRVVNPYGITVKQFSAIGGLRPPKEITAAVIAKTTATQNAITAENQLREIRANAAKKVAEAEGEAKANNAKTVSITPVLLEWERLKIETIKAGKWDGVLPSTVLGSGSNTLFSLNHK
jgi:regulator of protease activity HflC (stomatin/prohibitin superfamily)